MKLVNPFKTDKFYVYKYINYKYIKESGYYIVKTAYVSISNHVYIETDNGSSNTECFYKGKSIQDIKSWLKRNKFKRDRDYSVKVRFDDLLKTANLIKSTTQFPIPKGVIKIIDYPFENVIALENF
jgi:hypothetical protein